MDWFDFLEESTRFVENNNIASDIRRELLYHLESISSDLVSKGWSMDEASEEALHRMGSPEDVARGFVSHQTKGYHPIFWLLGWIMVGVGAIGMTRGSFLPPDGDGVLWTVVSFAAIIGLVFLQTGSGQTFGNRLMVILGWIKAYRWSLLAALIVGVIEGFRPVWLMAPYTMPSYFIPIFIILMAAATGVAVLLQFVKANRRLELWSPGILSIGMGILFGVSSTITAVVCGHIWTHAPSPWGDWFGPGFVNQNSHLVAIYAFGIWSASTLLSLGATWWIKQREISIEHLQ